MTDIDFDELDRAVNSLMSKQREIEGKQPDTGTSASSELPSSSSTPSVSSPVEASMPASAPAPVPANGMVNAVQPNPVSVSTTSSAASPSGLPSASPAVTAPTVAELSHKEAIKPAVSVSAPDEKPTAPPRTIAEQKPIDTSPSTPSLFPQNPVGTTTPASTASSETTPPHTAPAVSSPTGTERAAAQPSVVHQIKRPSSGRFMDMIPPSKSGAHKPLAPKTDRVVLQPLAATSGAESTGDAASGPTTGAPVAASAPETAPAAQAQDTHDLKEQTSVKASGAPSSNGSTSVSGGGPFANYKPSLDLQIPDEKEINRDDEPLEESQSEGELNDIALSAGLRNGNIGMAPEFSRDVMDVESSEETESEEEPSEHEDISVLDEEDRYDESDTVDKAALDAENDNEADDRASLHSDSSKPSGNSGVEARLDDEDDVSRLDDEDALGIDDEVATRSEEAEGEAQADDSSSSTKNDTKQTRKQSPSASAAKSLPADPEPEPMFHAAAVEPKRSSKQLAETKASWMTIFLIFLFLLIGAAGGAAAYYLLLLQ